MHVDPYASCCRLQKKLIGTGVCECNTMRGAPYASLDLHHPQHDLYKLLLMRRTLHIIFRDKENREGE